MACVYVLRQGEENIFKIGRTGGKVSQTIQQLSRGNPLPLTEFERVDTEDATACETFLHQRLRSKRIVQGGGIEFFGVAPVELRAVIAEAREFVTEFLAAKAQADELSKEETDPGSLVVKPSKADLDIYSKLLEAREAEDRLKVEREFLESKLKLSIGRASSLEKIATWKGKWTSRFEISVFRETEPDLYAELARRFETRSYGRVFLLQKFK